MDELLIINVENYPPIAYLRVQGFLAQLEVYKLQEQTSELLENGKRHFILDLKEVEFIDSAGIGAIAGFRNDVHKAGGGLVIVQPGSKGVLRALMHSKLTDLIDFSENSETAIERMCEKFDLPSVTASPAEEGVEEALNSLVERVAKSVDAIGERLDSLERQIQSLADPKSR